MSRLTSAISVHNALLVEHPGVLAALYRGYVRHRRGEEQPGELPDTPYRVPVYSNVEGKVSARYVRSYISGEFSANRILARPERNRMAGLAADIIPEQVATAVPRG